MSKDKKNVSHLGKGAKIGIASAIGGGIFLLVLIVYSSGLFEGLSLKYLDFLFNLRGEVKAREDIVIVTIDAEFKKNFRKTNAPTSRVYMAKIIDSLVGKGAEIIAFDMLFQKPDWAGKGDDAVAGAIDRAWESEALVVLASKFDPDIGLLTPLDNFESNNGVINVESDKQDLIVRRIFALFPVMNEDQSVTPVPTFSSMVVIEREVLESDDCRFGEKTEDFTVKLGDRYFPEEKYLINFTGGSGNFRYFSAYDLLANPQKIPDLSGATVLIADTTPETQDFYSVPFGNISNRMKRENYEQLGAMKTAEASRMAGVEVHANAIQTLLDHSWIRPVGRGVVFTLIIIMAILSCFLFYFEKIPGWGAAIIGVSLIALEIGISHIQFAEFSFFDMVPVLILTVLNWGGGAVFKNLILARTNRQVEGMFGQYVSPQIVEKILTEGVDISNRGKTEDVTVLFSDIRGFTSISEKLSPEEIGILLNNYFDNMITIVFNHDGTLDKLMGDAIMAFFGDPIQFTDHPHKACRTAIDMMAKLKALKDNPPVPGIEMVNIGIGLNSGVVTVGDLGSSDYRDYTVIGDNVNLGSRVEGLNKLYGTNIIITEFTRDRIGGEFVVRKLDMVRVKGKSEPVTLFELLSEKEQTDQSQLAVLGKFEEGLDLYFSGEFRNAAELFEENLKEYQDPPSEAFLKRCREYLENPPKVWDGIYTATSK